MEKGFFKQLATSVAESLLISSILLTGDLQ